MKPVGIIPQTHQINGVAPMWSNLATHRPITPTQTDQVPSDQSDRSDRFRQSALSSVLSSVGPAKEESLAKADLLRRAFGRQAIRNPQSAIAVTPSRTPSAFSL
jgi:hypothetical protein